MTQKPNKASLKKKPKTHSLRQDLMMALLLLMCVPFVTLGYVIYRVDLQTYHGVIEDALSEKAGRKIKLAGEVSWALTPNHGISLAVTKLSIGNPSWASRPLMAQVGEAKLHIELIPLFKKQLNIVAFELNDADVQLESNKNGKANWTFAAATAPKKNTKPSSPTVKRSAPPVTINVNKISIKNSRFGFLGKDGSLKLFTVPRLTLLAKKQSTRLAYKGTFSGMPLEIDLIGGRFDQINAKKWPFNVQVVLDKLNFDAKGSLQNNIRKVVLNRYILSGGKSKINGHMTVTLGGARPHLKGLASSAAVDPDDFKVSFKDASKNAKRDPFKAQDKAANAKRIFSAAPMDFSALKAVDLDLSVMIDELAIGMTSISSFMSNVRLNKGTLTVSKTKGRIAKSMASMALELKTNTSKPKLTFAVKANDMDMSKFVKLGGLESIIEGKADIDVAIKTHGNSMHQFASYSNGHINVLMDTGMIASSTMKSIAGSLLNLFAPGVNSLIDAGINCLAARYTLSQGLLETKGLLIDTVATTIAGTGYANLADERVNMSLLTKPKILSIGSMLPSMQIRGPLINPSFKLDSENTIEKVTGLLSGMQRDNGVPKILKIKGRNACAATLDNPAAARAQKDPQPVLTPGIGGSISKSKVGTLLKNLSKGFFNQ